MLGYAARHAAIAPLCLLEAALYDRRVRAHALAQPPIFVLGHWRSGTTFLQSLLALDPHLTTSNLYQSLFPDVFLLTEARCKPWLNRLGRALGESVGPHDLAPRGSGWEAAARIGSS